MRSNRYVVALAGVIFHLMIGSVYAWSVYAKPIASQTSWSESAISFAFSSNGLIPSAEKAADDYKRDQEQTFTLIKSEAKRS